MATENPKPGSLSARIVSVFKSVIDIIRNMKPERIQRNLVDPAEVEKRVEKLKHWTPSGLACELHFESYAETAGFFNAVAAIAAAFDHYPTVTVEKNRLRIFVTTPGVGLTEADFALVERIEEMASQNEVK